MLSTLLSSQSFILDFVSGFFAARKPQKAKKDATTPGSYSSNPDGHDFDYKHENPLLKKEVFLKRLSSQKKGFAPSKGDIQYLINEHLNRLTRIDLSFFRLKCSCLDRCLSRKKEKEAARQLK
jgi:hypothetical protein